jgi:predicted transcriptional regulator
MVPRQSQWNQWKFRGNIEIVSNVLWAISGGNYTKIRLMDNAYLTHEQTEIILDRLLTGELVSVDPTSCTFQLTEKGSRLLDLYRQIADLMPSGISPRRTENGQRPREKGSPDAPEG